VAKRAFDVAFSLAALAFLAPLWALIAAAVRLGDSGPVFYRQERVGLGGRPFTLLKFRTMAVGADALVDGLIAERACAAVFFKVPGDQRVTRVGRVLRRWSLDETPQFWNVLRGEMSVVGPRPQVAREVAEYAPEHFKRLDVRPGITGLWQVSGRNSLTVAESLRLDLEYVCGFGPLADLRVLVRTVPAIARSAAEDW
jgi:lipopolysaccharide/colanic/teichoic acid biosynthesis glycosyltransferase